MKNIFYAFLYISCSATYSQNLIRPEHAINHKGDMVNLVGLISHVENIQNPKGSSMVMSINGTGSNQLFIVLLLKSDSQKFQEEKRSAYLNRYVHVKGKVELHDGRPQIIIKNENQISFTRDLRESIDEPE